MTKGKPALDCALRLPDNTSGSMTRQEQYSSVVFSSTVMWLDHPIPQNLAVTVGWFRMIHPGIAIFKVSTRGQNHVTQGITRPQETGVHVLDHVMDVLRTQTGPASLPHFVHSREILSNGESVWFESELRFFSDSNRSDFKDKSIFPVLIKRDRVTVPPEIDSYVVVEKICAELTTTQNSSHPLRDMDTLQGPTPVRLHHSDVTKTAADGRRYPNDQDGDSSTED
jgi:hypothetical protein